MINVSNERHFRRFTEIGIKPFVSKLDINNRATDAIVFFMFHRIRVLSNTYDSQTDKIRCIWTGIRDDYSINETVDVFRLVADALAP